jgi:hypothetical protein
MRNRAGTLLAVAGVLSGMLAVPSPMAAAATPDASAFTFLTGTVALSPSDVWAVGWNGVSGTDVLNSESLHWNGHKWAGVGTVPGLAVNGLQGVSATGPSDIWAVGFLSAGSLIERYNGHKWATVPCPCQGVASQLNGVDARTTSDAWAVGYYYPSNRKTSAAFALHWNGHTWTQVTTAPVKGSFIVLNSVLDLGPDDVLAVGDYETKSHGTYVEHELAERWNGQVWQRVSVPTFSTASFLQGISGAAPAAVTAVGAVSSSGSNVPLIERWNGTRFVRVTQQVSSGYLNAVTVLSGTSAYAAGQTGSGTTLIEHYDGTRWAQVSTPSPADGGYFSGVAVAPSGPFAVAVGSHGPDNSERSLIEQGNGQTWHITHQ